MKIGIDIDDTITDLQEDLLKEAIEYDKTLRNKGIIYPERQYIGQKFDWNEEEKEYYLGTLRWKVMNNAKIRDGVIETLNQLRKDGHEVIFITARSDRYHNDPYNATYNWLIENNIPFDKLITSALDKGKVCKEENIDVFIDDQEKNCLLVQNSGTKTIYFDIKHLDPKDNFITCYNWYDILRKIEE